MWRSGVVENVVDRFVALTRFAEAKLAYGGVPLEKIRVVGNFTGSVGGGVATKGDYVLYLGRLSGQKGLATVLAAMRGVRGVILKVAGSGPMEGDMERFIEEGGRGCVEVLGHVSGEVKERLIAGARAVVVPSNSYENFPLVILEAFSQGTGVVVSRVGGLGEIVEDGVTGLLFPAGNSAALAACLRRVASEPGLAERLGQAAQAAARDRFGPEKHLAALVAVYREAIEERGRKAGYRVRREGFR
jgi:glycosyltransferase involved in cell wall biosynthesis